MVITMVILIIHHHARWSLAIIDDDDGVDHGDHDGDLDHTSSCQVKPGYLRELLPEAAPQEGEEFNKIFGDIERVGDDYDDPDDDLHNADYDEQKRKGGWRRKLLESQMIMPGVTHWQSLPTFLMMMLIITNINTMIIFHY